MFEFTKKFVGKLRLISLSAILLILIVSLASPLMANDEIQVDSNDSDDGVYETSINTAVDLGAHTGHDLQFRGNATTINVANGEIIGGASTTTRAITADSGGNDATGDTLTITNDGDNATAAITIRGDIDDGDTNDFNLSFVARTEDSNHDESLTVDIAGGINLGAGDLKITGNDANNGDQQNVATVLVTGDITANGGIAFTSGFAQDGSDLAGAVLILDGTAAAQTVTGAITAVADADGTIIVRNTSGTGVTFASAIGVNGANEFGSIVVGDGTAAGDAVFSSTVDVENVLVDATSGASTATFNGNLTTTGDSAAATGLIKIVGGNGADETATADFNGNIVAAGIIEIDGGTNASAHTVVTMSGATITAAGTIDIDNGSASATLTFDGTSAQTVNPNIDGVGSAEGTVNIANSSAGGVTFEGEIGAAQDIAAIVVGSADGTNSVANFTDDSGATAWTLGNGGSTTDTVTVNIDSDDGALTIAGTINDTTDTSTINITDTGAGAAGNAVTFSGVIGGTTPVDTIAVGSATLSGNADFDANVSATNLTLTAGNAASETAVVDFASGTTATITAVTITGGAADNSQDSTLTCTDCIGAITAITLDDDVGQATVAVANAAARAFGGTIDGATAGEGTLTVNESDNTAAPDAVTFSGNIGGTAGLLAVTVGTDNSTAGNAVFSGNVTANTFTAASGGHANEDTTVSIAGNLTATTVNVNTSAAAAAAKTDFTVTGTLTATTVNAVGGANDAGTDPTLFLKGDASVATVNLDDNGATATLTANGTAAQTLTIGNIRGTANGDGVFQNSNTAGVVTVVGTIGATATIEDITLDASTSTTFQSTVAISDDMAIGGTAGTTTIGATVTVGDDLTIGDSATIAIASTLGAGDTVFATTSNAAVINDDDNNGEVTVKLPSNFTSGAITLINDDADISAYANEFTVTDNQLTDYTVQSNGGDNTIIEITAAAKSASAAAAELGVSEEAATAIQNAAQAFNSDSTLRDLLTTALTTGGETARKAASTLQGSPASSTAAGGAAVTATGTQVVAVGSSRMASLRTGNAFASAQRAGFAAGEDVLSKALWFKPFVNFADQTQRKGIAGYETETYGGALGADVKIGNSTVGMSFSYANTDVDSKGDGNAQTDIDSYQGTIYADYTTSEWYIEGLFGYARNEIDASRTITLNNLTAVADYGSNQYMASVGFGMPIEVDENQFITPKASFQYTLVDNETYTETGAGSANLRVDQDNVNQALAEFGLRYHTNSTMDSGTLTPELRASFTYDFANDEAVSTSNFNGGGATFQVEGANVQEAGFRGGIGASFIPLGASGLTVAANYDVWAREDFVSHSANLSLRLRF